MLHRLPSTTTAINVLRRFSGAIAATAALTVLAVSQAHAAGRVFFDDFETGTNSKWDSDGSRTKCNPVRAAADGGPVRTGAYVLECNWNGAVTWDDPRSVTTVSLKSWNYSREFFIRFWVRYGTDVDRAGGNKLFKLSSQDGKNDFILNGSPDVSPTQMVSYFPLIAGTQGPTFWGNGQEFADGKWHEVEIYVKHNADGQSDGAFKVWQDGKAKQTLTNVKTVQSSSSKWYPMYLMSNWSNNPGWEHDAGNHAYWDDVEVYSDSGTGASGSMADGTVTASGGTTPPPAVKVPSAPTDTRSN